MPRLVHPHHTIDTLDRTTGPHDPVQKLRHTLVGSLPLPTEPLTHHLLQHHQLCQVGALLARRVRPSIA